MIPRSWEQCYQVINVVTILLPLSAVVIFVFAPLSAVDSPPTLFAKNKKKETLDNSFLKGIRKLRKVLLIGFLKKGNFSTPTLTLSIELHRTQSKFAQSGRHNNQARLRHKLKFSIHHDLPLNSEKRVTYLRGETEN